MQLLLFFDYRIDCTSERYIRGVGSLVGISDLSFELILGYVFAPVAFILGIPWSEAVLAGNLLGQKIIINEFVAFASFKEIMDSFPKSQLPF